jgi:hypothetical protein
VDDTPRLPASASKRPRLTYASHGQLIVTFPVHQHLHGFVDRKAARLLPRREVLGRLQVLRNDRLRRNPDEQVFDKLFVVVAGLLRLQQR